MKKNELLLYQKNVVPSVIVMLFLIFNTFQTIITLNTIDVSAAGIRVMEIILTNIVLSFLVFIASFEIKRYSTRWSWVVLVIGVFQCLRYFILPSSLHDKDIFLTIVLPLEIAGLLLIFASIISLIQCGKYRMAKKELECRS